jgi:hypothetical protein
LVAAGNLGRRLRDGGTSLENWSLLRFGLTSGPGKAWRRVRFLGTRRPSRRHRTIAGIPSSMRMPPLSAALCRQLGARASIGTARSHWSPRSRPCQVRYNSSGELASCDYFSSRAFVAMSSNNDVLQHFSFLADLFSQLGSSASPHVSPSLSRPISDSSFHRYHSSMPTSISTVVRFQVSKRVQALPKTKSPSKAKNTKPTHG